MTTPPPTRPVPLPDDTSAPFFEAARENRLVIQRCTNCETYAWPHRDICSECLQDDLEWAEASGRGTVHSFGVMHRVYHPAFAQDVPYNLTVVELEEGPRINTNLVDIDDEAIEVGLAVEVVFTEVDDGAYLPLFRPAS
jgi:uncharacterized OB-fold protein